MEEPRTGKLIVIDGTDGSGKATQTKRLLKRVGDAGREVRTIAFPQYEGSFFGQLVRRYLDGEFGSADDVNPHVASVLFAMDRWHAKEQICEWLAQGCVVVLDRYVSANAGHQGAKIDDPEERAAFLEWVDELEFSVLGLPKPDIVVFLHMPRQAAQELLADRAHAEGSKLDIHEADPEHLRRAEEAYVQMAARKDDWRRIECVENDQVLPPDVIEERIWREVQALLEGG